jgi:stage V sporulation protein B
LTKDSLIKGTVILALAALIARVLGAVQRIPLVYLLGDSGMGSYTIAFNVYSILLVVATAGIPSALSKLISERTALGREAEAARIYRAAVWFAVIAGVVMTGLLYAAAPFYAVKVAHDPTSTLAIRAIAPALLLFPLIAIMRGYFQGRQHMLPNGLSQIAEQILRLVAAIGLAYALLEMGYAAEWAIAGASFGGVMGSVAAVAVMLYAALRLRRTDAAERRAGKIAPGALEASGVAGEAGDASRPGSAKSALPSGATTSAAVPPRSSTAAASLTFRSIYGMIFRISIPIVIFSMTVPLIYFIDSSIVIPLLEGQIGQEKAVETLGLLGGRAQSLAGIPIILAIALSQSVVPVISAAFARKDEAQLRRQTSNALLLSVLTGLPMVLAICASARSINIFMFGNDAGTAIIVVLTLSAMFQIVMQTSGAILMGLGDMKKLVLFVILGIAVKLAGSFLLAPWFGIYGIIASTALCFIVMTQCNLSALRNKVNFTVLGSRWGMLAATTLLAAAVGVGVEWLLHAYNGLLGVRISAAFNAAISGCASLAVYFLLLAMRVIRAEEAAAFPRPLQKLLRRFQRRPGGTPGRG